MASGVNPPLPQVPTIITILVELLRWLRPPDRRLYNVLEFRSSRKCAACDTQYKKAHINRAQPMYSEEALQRLTFVS